MPEGGPNCAADGTQSLIVMIVKNSRDPVVYAGDLVWLSMNVADMISLRISRRPGALHRAGRRGHSRGETPMLRPVAVTVIL